MKAIELLEDFIQRCLDRGGQFCINEWLNGDDMAVYVRRSTPRLLNEKRYTTLDIASISVYKRNTGQFTQFLAEAEELNPWDATYIESVLTPRFANFILKQGYTQVKDVIPPSFYKLKVENEIIKALRGFTNILENGEPLSDHFRITTIKKPDVNFFSDLDSVYQTEFGDEDLNELGIS